MFVPDEEIADERSRKMFAFSLFSGATAVLVLVEDDINAGSTRSSGTGVLSTDGVRWTRDSTSLTWWSENSSKGSRLLRIVPEKRTGSCGIIASRVRRSLSFIVEMSTPSMRIEPLRASRKRNSANDKVDLPVKPG